MADSEGVGHPLTLKVMRVSRPSLASHWQPFFSTSPSLSSHATASPLTLQGAEPLPGHPKTLRDLTVASPFLTLPASFGTIQLGETFSCVLSVNNEANVPVDDVCMRIEMQTSTNKVLLEERRAMQVTLAGEPERNTLGKGDSLEVAVSSEIKEVGQHVLGCTVSYRTPPGMQPATSGSADSSDPFVQSFRKFYKFMVTNPLSVKTKVHVPQSPSALLSEEERDKVFLEVHIQNLTPGPLWFERIKLEAVETWNVVDVNIISQAAKECSDTKALFADSTALMHSQDMRQYIYVLTPKIKVQSKVPTPPVPGSIIPLGRLDICWRSSMGEPGRLLTSVLSRRIPLPAPPPSTAISAAPPASAVPHYLQKSISSQPRPRSPSLQQRSGTPPPASPVKRSTTPGALPHPSLPNQYVPPLPPLPGSTSSRVGIEVDIVLLQKPPNATVRVGEPFCLTYRVSVSGTLPTATSDLLGQIAKSKSRFVSLAVQHVMAGHPPSQGHHSTEKSRLGTPSIRKQGSKLFSSDAQAGPSSPGMHSVSSHTGSIDMLTPRRVVSPPPGGAPTIVTAPVVTGTDAGGSVASPLRLAAQGIAVGGLEERLRRIALSEALGIAEEDGARSTFGEDDENFAESFHVRLPPPYKVSAERPDEEKNQERTVDAVRFLGDSAVFLPPIKLYNFSDSGCSTPESTTSERGEGSADITLSYLPHTRGFAKVGGLRVLLVKDEEKIDASEDQDESVKLQAQGNVQQSEAAILREWDTVAELWIR